MGHYPDFAERFSCAVGLRYPGLNQIELGKRLGVSNATIHHWMSGNKLPGMANLVQIAIKLGVSVEWLATGRGTMFPVDSDDVISVRELPPPMRHAVREMVSSYLSHAK